MLKTLTGAAQIGRGGQKCAILTHKFEYLGPKVNFLYGNPAVIMKKRPLLRSAEKFENQKQQKALKLF